MTKKLPIYKIVPKECDFLEIAIIDEPAIEEFFLLFGKEEVKIEFKEDKRIIKGAVMIPDKLIYRNDSIGERFVTYDVEGIKLAAELFAKNGFKFNNAHSKEILPINILETYFASETNEFGVPTGSWIVSAKVEDESLWNRLKGSENGFSFQSLFRNEFIGTEELNFNKNNNLKMDIKEKIMNAVNGILFGEEPKPVTVETIGDKVEEVIEDVKEIIEDVKEVVENVVETVEEVIEEVKDIVEEFAATDMIPTEEVPTDKPVTLDEVKQLITDAITQATQMILDEVNGKTSDLQNQVTEFGKQPINTNIEVSEPDNKYSGFKGM